MMEEIYIIKLKGLPLNNEESLRSNHKSNFYYRKDLTSEALLGLGFFQCLIGLTLVILAVINLINHSIVNQIGVGIWCGNVFVITGLSGLLTARKRKVDISKSKIQIKIFFVLSIVCFVLTISYFTLSLLGIRESTANIYLLSNIIASFLSEFLVSFLSIFVSVRVIWPGSLSFCAKDWPGHPKLKQKVIVSTQIYTDGSQQNSDVIRNLGPNCVISLSPLQSSSINDEGMSPNDIDTHDIDINQEAQCYSGSGQSGSTCPCCDAESAIENNKNDYINSHSNSKCYNITSHYQIVEGDYDNGDADDEQNEDDDDVDVIDGSDFEQFDSIETQGQNNLTEIELNKNFGNDKSSNFQCDEIRNDRIMYEKMNKYNRIDGDDYHEHLSDDVIKYRHYHANNNLQNNHHSDYNKFYTSKDNEPEQVYETVA